MGKLRIYWLKTLNKLSIYPLGNTPSAPSGSALVTLLVDRTEEWWGSVMDVGLDPELTKWSVHSGSATVLTGKGYKERYWLAVPPSTTSVIPTSTLPPLTPTMPMSAHTIPGTQDQYSRGRVAVRVRGQTGNRTNAGRAITPFMFNKEDHRVTLGAEGVLPRG